MNILIDNICGLYLMYYWASMQVCDGWTKNYTLDDKIKIINVNSLKRIITLKKL